MLSGFSLARTAIVSNELLNMQQQTTASSPFSSYGDRPQMGLDIEYGQDPASGAAFFQSDGRKHEDLKQMLDSNKDGLKLEAMKRIIGMIARGRDASDLFPAVVKNVVSKNIEVKKLVYVYLVRYAEEQQDLALLSISTFQRALKDPNQLIRASALRVLSSIRVGMIAPIVMLAIRDSAADMSPYVRKTAAHAIPKLYSVDPDLKHELVTVIEKLLSDRTTLVVGSAVMAFDEVCPERVDLIHKNYRKLCNLLVDVDEWGQVIIINMLTRYARTQFVNPNEFESDQDGLTNQEKFYEDSGSSSESNGDDKTQASTHKGTYSVDLDHRLLLRQTKPLLQSRNAAVVMAVAQLYHHIAPRNEVQIIAKALIRLLRSQKEVQSVVLTCIASMSVRRKSIFQPHIRSFFVRSSDPTHLKLLKLDILTNLASATTISLILREFQTYISSSDHSFVAATIQAIGRCAALIKEVTETCLSGLVQLMSNRDEHVVAESVVVIKKLLQTKSAEHYDIISQMANLIDFINVPAARASIIWLIGEYNEKVPKIAPDVLRKIAKSFVDEENIVKLQILNLAVKLYLTNPEQTSLLCQYIFTLARYDTNYDIRDRARFLRQFILPTNSKSSVLTDNARKIFLSTKPAPTLESKYIERERYQMGSLSHYLNMRATGYQDLPTFPTVAPDPSVRNIEGYMNESAANVSTGTDTSPAKSGFPKKEQKNDSESSEYSETDSSSSDSTTAESSDDNSDSEVENANVKESKRNPTNEGGTNNAQKKRKAVAVVEQKNDVGTSDSDSSSSSDTSSDSDSSNCVDNNGTNSDSETEPGEKATNPAKEIATAKETKNQQNSTASTKNLDLLLELDDIQPIGPVMTPSLGGFLTPGNAMLGLTELIPQNVANQIELVGPSYIDTSYKELVNKVAGNGLQVNYRYTRSPHLYSGAMVSIELQFINKSSKEIKELKMVYSTLPAGMQVNEFAPIQQLNPDQTATGILGIDFNDSTHAVDFEIKCSDSNIRVRLQPSIGELIRSVKITESYFEEERKKLRGMNEHRCRLALSKDVADFLFIKQKLSSCINAAPLNTATTSDKYYFVGQTLTSKSLVLITFEWITVNDGEELEITVNCEKMVIGSMVINELRKVLK